MAGPVQAAVQQAMRGCRLLPGPWGVGGLLLWLVQTQLLPGVSSQPHTPTVHRPVWLGCVGERPDLPQWGNDPKIYASGALWVLGFYARLPRVTFGESRSYINTIYKSIKGPLLAPKPGSRL